MSVQLIHGDCLQQMKLLPDKSVDLFICDLPYGQLNSPNREKQADKWWYKASGQCRAHTWDVKIDLAAFWEQVERLQKDAHTPVIHFCNTKFGIELINSKPDWFRYDLVWNKERGVSFLLTNKQPMRSHEMIYIFSKKGPRYNRIDERVEGKGTWVKKDNPEGKLSIYNAPPREGVVVGGEGGTRCALSVINMRNYRGTHPTAKPVALYRWLIERYSNPGAVVLDPTAGSFNSIEAAQQLGRTAIGMEMNDEFFAAAQAKFGIEVRNEIISPPPEDAV